VSPARRRDAESLMHELKQVEHIGEGPIADIARQRIRDEAKTKGMDVLNVTVQLGRIPDPVIEALPEQVRRTIHAVTLGLMDDPAGQLVKIEKLVGNSPHVPLLRNHLGQALAASGDYERSERVMAELVQEFPRYVLGLVNYVMILLGGGRLEEARMIIIDGPSGPLVSLSDVDPTRTEFHIGEAIGMCYLVGNYMLAIGKREQAKFQLEMLNQMAPNSPQALALAKTLRTRS